MSQLNLTIENPGSNELRKFGLVSAAIVVALFGLLLPWLFDFAWPKWPWILGGVLGLWGLLAPASLFFVYKYWMKFGQIAGWINTRIILGLLFFLLFFPVGVMMRLFASDPMRRKLDKDSKTYRIESAPLEQYHADKPY